MSGGYYVQVRNLTRGWTMTADPAAEPDTQDPALRSVLTAPLRVRWGFDKGLVPGHLVPMRVTFGIWARTVRDEPVMDLGDIVQVDVRLSATGPYLVRLEGGRITETPTDLVAGQPWASRTTVEVADLMADNASRFPTYGGRTWGNPDIWQTRLAGIGSALGRSIGLPTALATIAKVAPLLRVTMFGTSADSILERTLNSWAPDGIHHTLTMRHTPGSTAYPSGYVWADPADRPAAPGGGTPYTAKVDIPDPVSQTRYLVTPASRTEVVAFAPPLQLLVRDGIVTVGSTPGTTSPKRHPALSAAWCRVPAQTTRRRDHIINTVRLKGVNQSTQAYGSPNYDKAAQVEAVNAADVAARGNIARDVDTDLVLRQYATDDSNLTPVPAAVTAQAQTFLSDASVLASSRSYGGLEVYPHLMPADEAANVLPYLAPQPPGLGDGRVLRHVTVYALDDALVDAATAPGGFIAAAEVVIERGTLRYLLTTTPGTPTYTGASPSPITVGQFVAKSFAPVKTIADLDPAIRVDDLDQIGA